MSVQFNIDDIDIETRQKLYEKLPNGKRQLSIKTQTVIWYCAKMIGVPIVTQENFKDTFERIFEYEEIFGTRAVRWEEIYNELMRKKILTPVYYPIELEDVKLLIGSEIVCDQILTREEWKVKIKDTKLRLEKRTKEIEDSMKDRSENEVKTVDMKKISVVIPEPESNSIKDTLPINLPDNPLINEQNKSE